VQLLACIHCDFLVVTLWHFRHGEGWLAVIVILAVFANEHQLADVFVRG
jgi:hypothetical protein